MKGYAWFEEELDLGSSWSDGLNIVQTCDDEIDISKINEHDDIPHQCCCSHIRISLLGIRNKTNYRK